MDSYVERDKIVVVGVRSRLEGRGPSDGSQRVESTLAILRGGHLYGIVQRLPDGAGYFACVERVDGDVASAMGLEERQFPGGQHVRRRIPD